jgi:hypothetical protein
LRNLRVEHGFSGGNLADSRAEFEIQCVFENVALGSSFDGLTNPRAC